MIEQILMEMDAGPIKLWDIQRLGGGLSNQNYLLCHQKSHEKFVLKMPPQSTDTVIRMQEIEVYQQCARLGLSPELVAWSQEKAMLSRYVEADVLTPQMLNELPGVFEQCIGLIQTFHRAVKVDFSMSFDKIMYFMDKDAKDSPPFPKWFMTILSLYGLGFQLLIMALMLSFNLESYVIPFFIVYSVFLVVFVGLRKFVLK